MTNFFAGFSTDFFIEKAMADSACNRAASALTEHGGVMPAMQVESLPVRRQFHGPHKLLYPPCYWDQDATPGTPMCMVCNECKEHYR